MGNKQFKEEVSNHFLQPSLQELSPNVKESVLQTFNIFDKDNSKEIDPEEALNHWKNNFGKMSAKEFFNQVDFDGDGKITE